MFKLLCVTNRLLAKEDFLARIETIAASGPSGIILREKDLTEEEYKVLAEKVIAICNRHHVPCILHSFIDVALALEAKAIHLPMQRLREMKEEEKEKFSVIGASCHSTEEAKEAERLGCNYIIAGHIFATDCKKDLPSRGISYLQSICEAVDIPVVAIGGIDSSNIRRVQAAGAVGACVMSGVMCIEDVETYFRNIRKEF